MIAVNVSVKRKVAIGATVKRKITASVSVVGRERIIDMPHESIEKTYIAGEDIHSGDLVILSGNQLFNYNHLDESNYDFALGIAKQAGLLGSSITVVLFGECYIPGWGLTTDMLYYASSPSGKISSVAPHSGLLTPVGRSLSSDILLVDIDESIIL